MYLSYLLVSLLRIEDDLELGLSASKLYNLLEESFVLDIEDHVAIDTKLLVKLAHHVGEWNLRGLRYLFPYHNSYLYPSSRRDRPYTPP